MKEFAGKIAFITGGASGAGLGQARVFGRAGCRIAIADIRRAAIDEALELLRSEGIEAHGIELDITDRVAYAAAADEVEAVFGSAPQLLFNTAGVNSFGPLATATYEDFDWVYCPSYRPGPGFQGRLMPNAPRTCSVFFCICSCICRNTFLDCST